MTHTSHDSHTHAHGEDCGHTRVQHEGHVDYLHDGHLHSGHEGHYHEHSIAVSSANPADHAPIDCDCSHGDCDHEKVPHGDHTDHLVGGHLHFRHGDHCDDHGSVAVL